jgi:2-succinyl-5-enolpyruvyl-6-hydroxy-3-cyclohexene-1-carboxylate synthase
MPVRDADAYAGCDGPVLRVGANRGASGIDGTLATAAGFCAGYAGPVLLAIGDLALLHDLNSLALARKLTNPFPIVAINNDGGGIFSFLPISAFTDVFEPYFGTPHGLRFESAASMFGIPYAAPGDRHAFEADVRAALERTGPTLIEVTTDRQENADEHRRLDESVSLAVTRALAASGSR